MHSHDCNENTWMVSTLKVCYELQELQTELSILPIHTMFLSVFAFLKDL